MSGLTFKRQRGDLVETIRETGVTSSAPVKIHKVPRGSAIKAYPTSAGTATVYSTQTPRSVSDADNTNTEIENDTNANWDAWGAGAVTVATVQEAMIPLETVAIVVTSGTWVLEVSA